MAQYTNFKLDSSFAYAGEQVSISTSQDYKNIYASFNSSRNSDVNVKFELMEFVNYSWRIKETKNGGRASSGSSRSVTFYNYSTAGARRFKVRVYLYDGGTGYTNLMQTAYSYEFTR
ncbi:hypothetical protein [Terribacillus sp. AE2B 122]|uniref:hypothetical protein n=1 Tax=Terribacillus sp. AE2B 122 TaxID=1331902 RepID=UPI0015836CF2|nr:hypothetical protein [Terribacillus sp. AE2B 122]